LPLKSHASKVDMQALQANPDNPHFVKSLDSRPGTLDLSMNKVHEGSGGLIYKTIPFVFSSLHHAD
jgi:alpha,alpha-trehalase